MSIKGTYVCMSVRSRLWLQRHAQAQGKSLSRVVAELIERNSRRLVAQERAAIQKLKKEVATL
jgi:hypothetical protein